MLRLNSTDRFGVWGSTDGLVLEESTTPLPLGQVVLGNRRATLSDICRIAALGQTVSCDEVSLALMMENSAHNPVSPLFVGTSSAVTAPATPEVACRAMVIGLLTSMLHGKSAIRPLVAVFLTKMLNAKIIPAFSDALSFGYELASAITGVDVPCYSSKGIIVSSKTAFSQMKLKAISLTQLEATFMSNKFFYTLGYASLLAGGAMNVSLTLDSIAALSCEAYGADLSNFDANSFENIRQQRGQITSASNLRNLLEGSKRLSNSSSAISCFAVLPQIHGPAQDIIISSSKYIT
jgi:histidine ammonia-lyase